MSKYAFLSLFLVLSSVYPVMIVLEFLTKTQALYLLSVYGICVFAISYMLTKTIYEYCVAQAPFAYHIRECWLLYLALFSSFIIYYKFYDQCAGQQCRDYMGAYWALIISIPMWVNAFFLALECGAHKRYTLIHILMLSFLTAGGCAMLLMIFSMIYGVLN